MENKWVVLENNFLTYDSNKKGQRRRRKEQANSWKSKWKYVKQMPHQMQLRYGLCYWFLFLDDMNGLWRCVFFRAWRFSKYFEAASFIMTLALKSQSSNLMWLYTYIETCARKFVNFGPGLNKYWKAQCYTVKHQVWRSRTIRKLNFHCYGTKRVNKLDFFYIYIYKF